jgi:hypothetical protein
VSPTVSLGWKRFDISNPTGGWKGLKAQLSNEDIKFVCSRDAVYVIRLKRPFSIFYGEDTHSPVIYIGKGDFKTRITSHLKNWISPLFRDVGALGFEFYVCIPLKKWSREVMSHDVEADLIWFFEEYYQKIPLKNRRREHSKKWHEYNQKEIRKAIGIGKGPGFHWALSPIGSNYLTRE